MSVELFGRLVSAATIERGVEVTLRYHLGRYLAEVLEQAGQPRDALADPTDLERVVDLADFASSAQIALVVVASPGTVRSEADDGESHGPTWSVSAGAIVDLGDGLTTREAAQLYAAAAGAAVEQQGVSLVAPDGRTAVRDADGYLETLEGSSVRWVGERFRIIDRLRPGIIAGEALLEVTVLGARRKWAPDLPPPGEPVSPTDRTDLPAPEPAPVDPSLTIDRRTPTED